MQETNLTLSLSASQPLSGDKPFRHIHDVISQQELRAISDHCKQVAGISFDALKN